MESRESSSNASLSKGEVLALDIATLCGYYCPHKFGTWDFRPSVKRNQNKPYKAFHDALTWTITRHGIRQLVVEDINVNRFFTDMRKLAQLHGIMRLVCEQMELPPPMYVNVSALKKWATGNGRATKEEMIRACEEKYRFFPRDDNQADAFLIFHYYCRKYRIP